MVVEKLYELPDDELRKLADERGIEYSDEFTNADKDFVIYALATFPETDNTEKYVESISIGDIVAFRTKQYRVKSAKIVKKSTADKKLLLETKYGKQHLVPYSDIVWVNTTGHWPRWVYDLLKGVNQEVECENTDGEEA